MCIRFMHQSMLSSTIPHPGYIKAMQGDLTVTNCPRGGVLMCRNLNFVKSHSINKGRQRHLTMRCAQGGGDILSNPHLVNPGWGVVGLNIDRCISSEILASNTFVLQKFRLQTHTFSINLHIWEQN